MKNYKDTDYSANKYSKGIVYRFANQTISISLDDYLAENPGKSEKDFIELKNLSDQIYLEQDRKNNAQSKKNICIDDFLETDLLSTPTLEDEYFESLPDPEIHTLKDGLTVLDHLTKIQRRRYLLHYFKGKTMDEIAALEHVDKSSVFDSIEAAKKKIKKCFKKL